MAKRNIAGDEDTPARPPGHSTADLGPSDSSDSGSDIAGAPGTADDAGLDADTDAGGTGERKAAGRDAGIEEGSDIAPDRITRDPGGLLGGDDPEGIGVSSDRDRK